VYRKGTGMVPGMRDYCDACHHIGHTLWWWLRGP
jgi:hypothetical protein